MAQGAGKPIKAKGKSGGSQRKNTGKTKPGKREVAPKDRQRVLERSQKKQLSSKINNSIEKQMVQAASVGKLSIMRNVGELESGEGKDSKAKGKGKSG
ncbi:hypothetical protein C343_02844 [Cryptococcus neoformans C23]|uniref:Uncharacterized protein n=1 Tax=Cryptococcus neoformans (strain H99 / ATCC 208821 / CBS 10515 / FGSC 9487) TaxID=235443 RepID=J9VSR4_CRYN9|nr:hypothetical protein CNAG_01379 [Cryptococcus neoformans var. grubii H99]AUB24473.1 hypothetical protein CKF44_01379 [Cryptococcus neoformans var. grubii]OWZ32221.1 hypothetical protein C347_02914 [Cryptococcus neoformans var. grubii AD2-60a]OWZ44891.1 hypothetical protein C343_02844 [Cryptococcus neoformans var. grubii C23]OXC85104.1 hypothetical protein C344_02609 [Cryptococcus neoformans var. grubii AD1-7a]AFR94765.1 hypothetical protein CNAG_01379 [Cryptococcus neoformans var. grubii H9|eukprot:XP_012049506.1 hypothetical protein CNAG_01379 [Cryptococcus neoformans var. grubii H99]